MATDPPAPPPTPNPINPIVAFIIGLAIILLASILNAAGLNITKLDHVHTSAIPKSARKKDWMRPLWLLGMLLYILSQLIGSTLALEYMRAEYVAPLGSTSLVFNFLFARFLVGTPVTSTDIYGTIVVILGVIGIVAFGSINSGLTSKTDVAHLTYLWRRPGWLSFFFFMTGALLSLFVLTGLLDAVLVARGDLGGGPPTPPPETPRGDPPGGGGRIRATSDPGVGSRKSGWWRRIVSVVRAIFAAFRALKRAWNSLMVWITGWLEIWAAPQDDKLIAWTLGIGWACCGGGLAGGCLVFAKATVKLLSGSLSNQNPGNQFGHAAPIFTILLLAATAVLQIICLNRGLKVYDSTLVVPVFYGVYTATGFLDSLIFNDEVDAYKSWTLFLIFASMIVLISGVVLLTHKKPEPTGTTPLPLSQNKGKNTRRKGDVEQGEAGREGGEGEHAVLWAVGNDSDDDSDAGEDEDIDHHQHPIQAQHRPRGGVGNVVHGKGKGKEKGKGKSVNWKAKDGGDEGVGLIGDDDDEDEDDATVDSGPAGGKDPTGKYQHLPLAGSGNPSSSGSTLNLKGAAPFKDDSPDEFGDWEGVGPDPSIR
ncbi:hypothetical protein Hypma_007848 [Hypsizygus marmoreus]|uniref:Magnesium transporter NIPA8 n=1 Tax=Hypsizygus marmoreus TaxID=39966 RepID=A0A369K0L4_HYPMA|nr:hypothetical protein Hypma_007848 [Hypsizygus marmoreus]